MAYPYQSLGFSSPLHAHISDAPDEAEDDNRSEHPSEDGSPAGEGEKAGDVSSDVANGDGVEDEDEEAGYPSSDAADGDGDDEDDDEDEEVGDPSSDAAVAEGDDDEDEAGDPNSDAAVAADADGDDDAEEVAGDPSSDAADAEGDDDNEDEVDGDPISDAADAEGDDDNGGGVGEGKGSDAEPNSSGDMSITEDDGSDSNASEAPVVAQDQLGADDEYEVPADQLIDDRMLEEAMAQFDGQAASQVDTLPEGDVPVASQPSGGDSRDVPNPSDNVPVASQHGGGGPRDVPDPSFILRSAAKRQIKLTPQAPNVMKVYAAIRAIPPSPIDFTEAGPSTVQLPDLDQGQISWEPSPPTKPYDPNNSPHILSLRFQNEANDDPDAIAIPLADLHEDPFAPLAGVHDYLLSVAGRENKKPEDFGLQPRKRGRAPSITSIEAEGDDSAEDGEDYNEDDLRKQPSKMQNPEPGRPPRSAQEVLDAGINVLGSVRRALANLAGVSEAYVQKRWDRANGTARGDGQDIWRLFTSYFHENVDEMIELANPSIPDGVERASNTVASLCYPAFKAKYPNGKYREILIAYEDICKLTGRSKTMHARVADWNAHARKLGEIGETGHGKAFETLSLSCGSNVNQDKSLSAVCESALAEGFITSKLDMPPSELLGHFIAYVQNQLSQTILDERAGQPASKAAATKSARPSTSKVTVDIEDPSIISISDDIKPGSKKRRYELVRRLARAEAAKAGLVIPKGSFPWLGLTKILVTQGYQLINWPVAVTFPGREKAARKAVAKGKKRRGVTGLNAEATDSLIANFSPDAKQQIQFVKMSPQQAEAATLGNEPVIITAAPEPGSRRLQGMRLFPDQRVDMNGPPQLAPGDPRAADDFVEAMESSECDSTKPGPSTARTRIKKKKPSPLHSERDEDEEEEEEEEELAGDSDSVVATRPMTRASAKKVAKPVTSKPQKTARVASNDSNHEPILAATSKPRKKAVSILAATSKPQTKAVTVEVVQSDDSDDEPVRPAAKKLQKKAVPAATTKQLQKKAVPAATTKPQKKAVTATDGSVGVVRGDDGDDEHVRPAARKLQKKAQVVASNDSDDKSIVSVPSTATVAIKRSQPDQPSDDEDEQVQIVHPAMKRHIARIQSPESNAERGVEPETPTPVGSGTGHSALKLRRSLVAGDSGRAAEASKTTGSSTSKAAPLVPEVAATIAEPESPTPVGLWTSPILKQRKPLVAGGVPQRSAELSKPADATSLASEAALPDAEAAGPKHHKKKRIASSSEVAPKAALRRAVEELPLTSEAAPPEAAGPKHHKTNHVASSSEVAAKAARDAEAAVVKGHKTKHVASSSEVVPKAAPKRAAEELSLTSEAAPRDAEASVAKRHKTKHVVSSSEVVAKAVPKSSKTKDATTPSTSEAATPVEATVADSLTTKGAPKTAPKRSKPTQKHASAVAPAEGVATALSTSKLAPETEPVAKTKNATTPSTSEAATPVEAIVADSLTTKGAPKTALKRSKPTQKHASAVSPAEGVATALSTGELAPETEPVAKLGKMKRSATSSTSEVTVKRSKTKHVTGSTTEASQPPPVPKRTKTKDSSTVKRTKSGNDKGQGSTLQPDAPEAASPVQQGPQQHRQPPSLDGSNTMAWEDRYRQPPGLNGSNTAPWDSYPGPFNAQLDPGMDPSNSGRYPPSWPYPPPPGYGRPHLPAFNGFDAQHGPPSYFPDLYNPYVRPPHPNYAQGRPAHDMYGLQEGSGGTYLRPPFEYPRGRSPHDMYGGPLEGSSGPYIRPPHSRGEGSSGAYIHPPHSRGKSPHSGYGGPQEGASGSK